MGFSVDPYLGRPYDPASYDCWDMLREAWLELTGFDMGARPRSGAPVLALGRHFQRLAGPASPAIALMRRPRVVSHVGLFWQGRVLHNQPGGVRFDRPEVASLGFTEVAFYHHAARSADR